MADIAKTTAKLIYENVSDVGDLCSVLLALNNGIDHHQELGWELIKLIREG
jgi:hypothetical protein